MPSVLLRPLLWGFGAADAVVIGVTIFGELFTARLAAGIGLILLAVTLIVAGKSLHPGRLAAIIGHRGFLRHSR